MIDALLANVDSTRNAVESQRAKIAHIEKAHAQQESRVEALSEAHEAAALAHREVAVADALTGTATADPSASQSAYYLYQTSILVRDDLEELAKREKAALRPLAEAYATALRDLARVYEGRLKEEAHAAATAFARAQKLWLEVATTAEVSKSDATEGIRKILYAHQIDPELFTRPSIDGIGSGADELTLRKVAETHPEEKGDAE